LIEHIDRLAGAEDEADPSYFRRLRELALNLLSQTISAVSLKELSMGMSNDDHVAIQEGASRVLVGSDFEKVLRV
jgi:uncharacterized pyridoxal phosphate-containing UPF0001 family protein